MENKEYYLCGGVYFSILCQISKQGNSGKEHRAGKRDDVTEPTMLAKLLSMIDSSKAFNFNKSSVSKYKACTANTLAGFDWSDKKQNDYFDRNVRNNYAKAKIQMLEFIAFSLDTNRDNDKWCVSALLKIIKYDKEISEEDLFYYNNDYINKKDLLKLNAYDFAAFLLAVFHFIIMNRHQNKDGEETADIIKNLGSDFADKNYFNLKIETEIESTENDYTNTQTTDCDSTDFEIMSSSSKKSEPCYSYTGRSDQRVISLYDNAKYIEHIENYYEKDDDDE